MRDTPLGEPFPLQTSFRRRFVPALLAFIGASLLLIGLTAKFAVEAIYLEMAQRRAQTIERAVAETSGDAWYALMSGKSLTVLQQSENAAKLAAAFETAVRRQSLLDLKVYDLNRRVLYATDQSEIGSMENGQTLRDVIADLDPGIVTFVSPGGVPQYELYVPVFDADGTLRTVFELYEPVGYLDAILIRSAIPIILIPGVLFLALGFALDRLVGRAQSDIDARTRTIDELRKRLESFVSFTAVTAARNAEGADKIPSLRTKTTLFFSDVRDFTGFSEQHTPEDVVAYLNTIMALQVEVIGSYGGDVDKMIGDAVLARFDGADGKKNAIVAAKEIQKRINSTDLPRGIGIGVYHGDVISGTIGPENRRDFTVIGDAVNVAARLCSEARAGEVVAEQSLADETFGASESVFVKGRELPVSIRRYISPEV